MRTQRDILSTRFADDDRADPPEVDCETWFKSLYRKRCDKVIFSFVDGLDNADLLSLIEIARRDKKQGKRWAQRWREHLQWHMEKAGATKL